MPSPLPSPRAKLSTSDFEKKQCEQKILNVQGPIFLADVFPVKAVAPEDFLPKSSDLSKDVDENSNYLLHETDSFKSIEDFDGDATVPIILPQEILTAEPDMPVVELLEIKKSPSNAESSTIISEQLKDEIEQIVSIYYVNVMHALISIDQRT
jgi:hypothetical protein